MCFGVVQKRVARLSIDMSKLGVEREQEVYTEHKAVGNKLLRSIQLVHNV